MSTNKIGEKVALFWIAWAFIEEKNGNIKLADHTYVKGLRYLAEPRDLLNKRYQQFQRRMTRKYLSGEGDNLESVSKTDASRNFNTTSNNLSFRIPQRSFGETISATVPIQNSNQPMPFAIFDESATTEQSIEPTIWPNLGSEAERKKENEGNF